LPGPAEANVLQLDDRLGAGIGAGCCAGIGVVRRWVVKPWLRAYDGAFILRIFDMTRFHDLTMESITGEPVTFADFQGRLCLIVNVASR
jgi:hypothetical protein